MSGGFFIARWPLKQPAIIFTCIGTAQPVQTENTTPNNFSVPYATAYRNEFE